MRAAQMVKVQQTNDPHVHVNIWVECKCGHTFWWDTYEYGPDIICADCYQPYYAMVTLLESVNE